MIKRSYILAVQDALIDAGVVKYASEEAAAADAAMLGSELDKLPIDQGAMAEGGVSPEATAQIATAVVQMAQEAGEEAEQAKAKADIAAQAAAELSQGDAALPMEEKGAEDASEGPGELATAVPNTAKREDVHGEAGHQADEDKGHIGTEAPEGEGSPGEAKATDKNEELATAVPNTAEREDVHGEAGHQADEDKGHVGTEEKQSALMDRLAKL